MKMRLTSTHGHVPIFLIIGVLACVVSPFCVSVAPPAPSSAFDVSPKKSEVIGKTTALSFEKSLWRRNIKTVRIPSSSTSEIPISDNASYHRSQGEYGASILSRLTYYYATSLIKLAEEKRLQITDAFSIPDRRKMGNTVPRLEKIYMETAAEESFRKQKGFLWQRDRKGLDSWILFKSLLRHKKKSLLTTGALRLLNTFIQSFPAILVSRLLRLIESNATQPIYLSFLSILSLVSVLSLKMIVENVYFHNVVKTATEVRGSLSGMIFDKSLKLAGGVIAVDEEERGKKRGVKKDVGGSVGGVLNLMQSDTSTMENVALQIHNTWDAPLQILIYTTLLYKYLGSSVLWGIAVLLFSIPVNSASLRLSNRISRYENLEKDARTKRTAEAVSNMKLLKLQAWEGEFAKDIEHHRKEELLRHTIRGLVRAINSSVSNAVPAVVLVVTLMAYSKSGNPILASTMFTAISLFNQLRFPLLFYPMLIDALANGRNSLERIAGFLSKEEITRYVQSYPLIGGEGGRIEMKNGNFLWSAGGEAVPALCDANIEVGPGEIVAVVGGVGSGKTALIKSLLGELSPTPGIVIQELVKSSQNNADQPHPIHQKDAIIDAPTVICHGPVAYCAQEAWLSKGTIRDAILFGREYDEERYLAAIRDAGLDEDIVNENRGQQQGKLTHDTEVGESGSSLSGGQRARVALARALYESNPGVVLLDDPLSALDANVGSTVFERLVTRLKKENAATIFVTNDPNLPRRCDKVVLMGSVNGGCATVMDVGSYDELVERGHDLRTIASDHHLHDIKEEDIILDESYAREEKLCKADGMICDETTNTCHADPDAQIDLECNPDHLEHLRMSSYDDTTNGEEKESLPTTPYKKEKHVDTKKHTDKTSTSPSVEAPSTKKLTSTDDKMSTGAVPFSTYLTYFRCVKNPYLILAMVLSFMTVNGAQIYQQYIVSKWTQIGATALAEAVRGKYLQSLLQAAVVVSSFLFFRSFLSTRVGIRASRFLHDSMLNSVFRAPVSFFDATPSGQLFSRFGKELDVVDRALPDGIASVIYCFMQLAFSATALLGVITPGLFLPLSCICFVYYKNMKRFRPAARDMKRCESKSRAPIYTHFSEALRGTETIRSIPGGRRIWSRKHRHFTDENLSVYASVKSLDRWLSIRLESLGNMIVLMAALASVLLTRAGRLNSGSAGWGITQSLSITGLLTWAIRCLTELETQMMSVQRIADVTDLPLLNSTASDTKIPKEFSNVGEALDNSFQINLTSTPDTDTALTSTQWPWEGGIHFKNVCMRYNPVSPLVLKNVDIEVPPGTTLGIVGRTGSGKSSLLLTLFRLIEIEGSGSIEIDGIDVRSVSLKTLRESLSIIPQNPVLFAGTIMYNLDATGKASEEDAWEALNAASPELAMQFQMSKGLDTIVTEGGKNLSLGQRQLICLARALLRKSKILVLDEATSSVDTKTDAQVQATIRREFVEKGVTVVTVAHRLDTVLSYDKIAVLDDGRLVEYGAPSDLLRRRGGKLRQLVDADLRNKRKSSAAVPKLAPSYAS